MEEGLKAREDELQAQLEAFSERVKAWDEAHVSKQGEADDELKVKMSELEAQKAELDALAERLKEVGVLCLRGGEVERMFYITCHLNVCICELLACRGDVVRLALFIDTEEYDSRPSAGCLCPACICVSPMYLVGEANIQSAHCWDSVCHAEGRGAERGG